MTNKNYSERILELMRIKGINKKELADAAGIAKQNVRLLLETNNIQKLLTISNILGVSLYDIIGEEESDSVKGCIVYSGTIYLINNKNDIEDLLSKIR